MMRDFIQGAMLAGIVSSSIACYSKPGRDLSLAEWDMVYEAQDRIQDRLPLIRDLVDQMEEHGDGDLLYGVKRRGASAYLDQQEKGITFLDKMIKEEKFFVYSDSGSGCKLHTHYPSESKAEKNEAEERYIGINEVGTQNWDDEGINVDDLSWCLPHEGQHRFQLSHDKKVRQKGEQSHFVYRLHHETKDVAYLEGNIHNAFLGRENKFESLISQGYLDETMDEIAFECAKNRITGEFLYDRSTAMDSLRHPLYNARKDFESLGHVTVDDFEYWYGVDWVELLHEWGTYDSFLEDVNSEIDRRVNSQGGCWSTGEPIRELVFRDITRYHEEGKEYWNDENNSSSKEHLRDDEGNWTGPDLTRFNPEET